MRGCAGSAGTSRTKPPINRPARSSSASLRRWTSARASQQKGHFEGVSPARGPPGSPCYERWPFEPIACPPRSGVAPSGLLPSANSAVLLCASAGAGPACKGFAEAGGVTTDTLINGHGLMAGGTLGKESSGNKAISHLNIAGIEAVEDAAWETCA